MTTISLTEETDQAKFIAKGYGASGALIGGKTLQPVEIERHHPEPNEVLIEVLYCGVCHSDIHGVNNDWGITKYPIVPGHEIIGRVIEKGTDTTKFNKGDIVGVGGMIGSCGTCNQCLSGKEHFCHGKHGMVMTYNGYDRCNDTKFNSYGGYSTHVLANENYVLRIPKGMDISVAAPILCAGVTTYSPLKYWKIKHGHKVGIVGIGGLGHMGVMIAKAMGAEVTAITTKEEKRDAAKELGADHVLISENKKAMEAAETSFDYLLATIPYPFDINPYLCLLKPHGVFINVGLLTKYDTPIDNMEQSKLDRTISTSLIGSIAETQEVIDFCFENDIVPHVELINIQDINDAFEKMKNEEVRFRYVIDMESLNHK